MARHRRIRFYKNKVISIDLARREILLHNNLRMNWDALVIALGSVSNYYGIPGAAEHTRPFKTLVDAMTLRARVVELFEMAEQAESHEQRRRLLSFVIVGGGVTGVEVAAELIEMTRETLLPRYPSLHRSDVTVTILEGGDRVVPTARPEHSTYVHRFLERRGVRVLLNARAARVGPRHVELADGSRFEGFTIAWTAGVHPPEVVRSLPLAHVKDGRVLVDSHLHALLPDGSARDDVYAIGDSAASRRPDGTYQPALSQTAIAMGAHVGEELDAIAHHRTARPFSFHDAGYIISLGKHSSVVDLFGVPFSGKLAWLLWAGAYLVKMVGLRKQIEVAIDHLTHFFFTHDTSQILNRRAILSDEELNLSLGGQHDGEPVEPAHPGQTVDQR